MTKTTYFIDGRTIQIYDPVEGSVGMGSPVISAGFAILHGSGNFYFYNFLTGIRYIYEKRNQQF